MIQKSIGTKNWIRRRKSINQLRILNKYWPTVSINGSRRLFFTPKTQKQWIRSEINFLKLVLDRTADCKWCYFYFNYLGRVCAHAVEFSLLFFLEEKNKKKLLAIEVCFFFFGECLQRASTVGTKFKILYCS